MRPDHLQQSIEPWLTLIDFLTVKTFLYVLAVPNDSVHAALVAVRSVLLGTEQYPLN